GLIAYRVEVFLRARPHVRRDGGAAVIADRLHRDETGAAGAHQMLAKTGIGLFGFLVAVGTDEAVEDLPERQRQVILILAEHGIEASQQLEGFLPRRPGRKSTRTGPCPLCTAE